MQLIKHHLHLELNVQCGDEKGKEKDQQRSMNKKMAATEIFDG